MSPFVLRLFVMVGLCLIPVCSVASGDRVTSLTLHMPILESGPLPVFVISSHGELQSEFQARWNYAKANRLQELPPEEYPRVVLAVWEDGTVIWSEDRLRGGRPYRIAHISVEAVAEFQKRFLNYSREFKSERLPLPPRHPHALYTVIEGITSDGTYFSLSSSHEYAEFSDPRRVDLHDGRKLIPEGKSREEVLASQPENFKRSLQMWTMIKEDGFGLIPRGGVPVKNEDAQFRMGKVTVLIELNRNP